MSPGQPPQPPSAWKALGALSTVGLSFVLAIVMGTGGGLLGRRLPGHRALGVLHRVLPRPGRRGPQRLPDHLAGNEVTPYDADPLLRRLERRALLFCAICGRGDRWSCSGGRVDVALGVVGGGVLIGVSYWAIRSSIDGVLALTLPAAPPGKGGVGRNFSSGPRKFAQDPQFSGDLRRESSRSGSPDPGACASAYGLRFVGRYAVLAGLAYVMLVWLRLHPVGLDPRGVLHRGRGRHRGRHHAGTAASDRDGWQGSCRVAALYSPFFGTV